MSRFRDKPRSFSFVPAVSKGHGWGVVIGTMKPTRGAQSGATCAPWSAGKRSSPVAGQTRHRSSYPAGHRRGEMPTGLTYLGVKSRPSPSASTIQAPALLAQLFGTWLHMIRCVRLEFSLMYLCTAILVSCVPFTELLSLAVYICVKSEENTDHNPPPHERC